MNLLYKITSHNSHNSNRSTGSFNRIVFIYEENKKDKNDRTSIVGCVSVETLIAGKSMSKLKYESEN